MRPLLVVIVLASASAACKGNDTDKGGVAPARAPVSTLAHPIDAAIAAHSIDAGAAAKTKPRGPGPTPAQIATFKEKMRAGWAAEKALKWADATRAFEAALKESPGDPRALGELGLCEMNAGDFAKARTADRDAVASAATDKQRAAALYNLGTVEERSGDAAAAARDYGKSIALRPNHTVTAALTKLAVPAAATTACASACDCIAADMDADPTDTDDNFVCKQTDDPAPPVPGFHVFHATREFHAEDDSYLVDEHGAIVTEIQGFATWHWDRSEEEVALDKAEVVTVGGHRVLRVTTSYEYQDVVFQDDDSASDADGATTGFQETNVTLCVLGDDKTPTTCPVRDAVVRWEGDNLDTGKKGKMVADLTIGSDGTATLKLTSGAADSVSAEQFGPHKLW